MIKAINYIDVARAVYGDGKGVNELPIACSVTPPLGDETAAAVKLLDAVITAISYVDIVIAIYG